MDQKTFLKLAKQNPTLRRKMIASILSSDMLYIEGLLQENEANLFQAEKMLHQCQELMWKVSEKCEDEDLKRYAEVILKKISAFQKQMSPIFRDNTQLMREVRIKQKIVMRNT